MSKTKVLNYYRPFTFRADKRECILNLYHVSKYWVPCCASHELKSVQLYNGRVIYNHVLSSAIYTLNPVCGLYNIQKGMNLA